MNDRELLEKAAKAAGIETKRMWHESLNMGQGAFMSPEGYPWNPLTDDGDALRLAAKLKISLSIGTDTVEAYKGQEDGKLQMNEGDFNAATRRAIVRAAAAIGETMK